MWKNKCTLISCSLSSSSLWSFLLSSCFSLTKRLHSALADISWDFRSDIVLWYSSANLAAWDWSYIRINWKFWSRIKNIPEKKISKKDAEYNGLKEKKATKIDKFSVALIFYSVNDSFKCATDAIPLKILLTSKCGKICLVILDEFISLWIWRLNVSIKDVMPGLIVITYDLGERARH